MTKEQYINGNYNNEDQFSAATYQYINNNYPSLRGFIFHVPNGGYRSKVEGTKMKSMGVVAGIPDYICTYPLFALELKMPNGVLSPSQKDIHRLWMGKVPLLTAYTPQQVIDFLTKTIN